MPACPLQPVIYEINAWTWLEALSRRCGRPVTLGSVPADEWDRLAAIPVDAVWLMGVWQRSPMGRRESLAHPALIAEYRRALPDFSPEDVSGSPYCIHAYTVDEHLGGCCGLQRARDELARRNLRLILDFVPNHVAPDHPWTLSHPEYFIQRTEQDLAESPADFFRAGDCIIAHGKDPYFAPWTDTAQLNAFNPGLRDAAAATLEDIAAFCDGVRCDMAMLLLNDVFAHTWASHISVTPSSEYWTYVIARVRQRHPEFLFIAEAYWDLESELQGHGFNYCYDKRLYDRLLHDSAENIRLHLQADLVYQQQLVRFLENHDEPRAASEFAPDRERAAAVVMTTVPGAKLIHEGQLEGHKVKLPVQLGRRPEEPEDPEIKAFYDKLLAACRSANLRNGCWQLCNQSGWPDNQSYRNLLSWSWQNSDHRHLVVLNFSGVRSQGRVQLPWHTLGDRAWTLRDLLSNRVFTPRSGQEMIDAGLFVDMDPWESYFFNLGPLF